MTLIVVAIPTVAGLLIGADSRLTLYGANWTATCGNVFKIAEVEGVERTAIFVTGYGTVWDLRNVPPEQLCTHIAKTKPNFDALNILAAAVRGGSNNHEISAAVADETARYVAANPNDFASRSGQYLFQAAIARYEAATQTSVLTSFLVNLDPGGSVRAGPVKTEKFSLEDEFRLSLFGEASYLEQAVFAGPGAQFLTERYGRFRSNLSTVEVPDSQLAADFVTDVIEAASRTTSLIPAQTGIGGPVDVLLIGKDASPSRMQWKQR
ncbi:hypothetical protein ACVWW4_006623 [Bradyrhizobium sp. LB7.1]